MTEIEQFRTFKFKMMKGGQHRKTFYVENFKKPISEQEFVEAVASWDRNPGKKNRSPSKARYQYRRLKEVYGFFRQGE